MFYVWFEVALPWKNGEPSLVNNKEATIQQFARGAMRKFLADPEYEEEYRRTLFEYINEGYAKKIVGKDLEGDQFFLVHHGVRKKGDGKIKEKLRIVFNSAAKFGPSGGKSLNDALLTGPPLQNDLVLVALGFRLRPIAVSSDITLVAREAPANVPGKATGRVADGLRTVKCLHRFGRREDDDDLPRDYRRALLQGGSA